ncbi:MAG: hypothetical protein M0R33_15545 [Methylomonas sp.]|jgi:hypothetical protein|uniref:hypothetical protein n=1 Tax=Methylomonas sp. TaxID=418 RepID=UPI0025D1B118|nr:hypothetical protein [Methylomonas sp.]MCK9607857.1 hypothetical protein [Methylomonas sp.]
MVESFFRKYELPVFIGFSGKAGSGKATAAKHLYEFLTQHAPNITWYSVSFDDSLRAVCGTLCRHSSRCAVETSSSSKYFEENDAQFDVSTLDLSLLNRIFAKYAHIPELIGYLAQLAPTISAATRGHFMQLIKTATQQFLDQYVWIKCAHVFVSFKVRENQGRCGFIFSDVLQRSEIEYISNCGFPFWDADLFAPKSEIDAAERGLRAVDDFNSAGGYLIKIQRGVVSSQDDAWLERNSDASILWNNIIANDGKIADLYAAIDHCAINIIEREKLDEFRAFTQ